MDSHEQHHEEDRALDGKHPSRDAQTKDSLAETVRALEVRFHQGDLRGKLAANEELEGRAKRLVAEGFAQTEIALGETLGDAKALMKEELVEAKVVIKEELNKVGSKARKGERRGRSRPRSPPAEGVDQGRRA